jgi:hypothetical protein
MRVEVTPRRLSVVPGQPSTITVHVTNTTSVISGHSIQVLGVDPRWVALDRAHLSLFPDDAGTAVLTVTFPSGIPAGTRHLSIVVIEQTPPAETKVVDVELSVPEELGVTLSVDPASVTGGQSVTTGVLVANTGNAPVEVELRGADDEDEVEFAFQPPAPVLQPGEQLLASATLNARRPWFGSPKVRPFTVSYGPPRAPVMAFGAWVQNARLSRGALALLGLAAAVTVFAVVLTASLAQVVNTSAADRDLAIQVAEASRAGASSGQGTISGTVSLLTANTPVPGATVQLYQASNTAQPIVSTATGPNGGYQFANLALGSYKVQFEGAGFTQLWYPSSLSPDDATVVNVTSAKLHVAGISVSLSGTPGSISGQVVGADPAGAVLTLQLPGPGTTAAVAGSPVVTTPAAGAVITTQTLDASGLFVLANVPSPATYQIVVAKQGYEQAVQDVSLGSGEQRTGVTITLVQGNGSISGTVSTAAGPLDGATITASSGSSSVTTVSLTSNGRAGYFVVNNLQTPATFTLLVGASGYATQTLSLSLAPNQQLTGVAVTLVTGVGSISGTVTTPGGAPAGGVTVTATNGQQVASTVTLSVNTPGLGTVGSYVLNGLPVPDTYTLTFSRSDLSSQTRAVDIPSASAPNASVNATLVPSNAAIYGTVSQQPPAANPPSGNPPLAALVGGISILLTSGTTSYQTTSASVATPGGGAVGAYEIDGITPGTYTISFSQPGGLPFSQIVTLAAGQRLALSPTLSAAAQITGKVVQLQAGSTTNTVPVQGAQIDLYLATQFPTVLAASTVTDANGSYTFKSVNAPTNYVVTFTYPPGSAAQTSKFVTTALGQTTTVPTVTVATS